MIRLGSILVFLALTSSAVAQDVYTPPVPIGIATEGKIRHVERPIPFPSEAATWVRVRTPRFDIISSADEKRTRQVARDLETLASALTTTSRRFASPATPTTIFVFGSRSESQPYFELLLGTRDTRATGAYVRYGSGGAMLVDGARRQFERTAMHELVHDLLREAERMPPLWIEEGLAEYFATAEIRSDALVAGRAVREHLAAISTGPAPGTDMLDVKVETPEALSHWFYAQSWAAVDWLMERDENAFWRFASALEDGGSVEAALQEHYGATVADFRRGIANAKRNRRLLHFAPGALAPDRPAEPLDRATLLYELGRFLSRVAGAGNDARRHYEEAVRIHPHHGRALAALGRFEAAIAAAKDDPEVHLAYAEALLETAMGVFAGVFDPQDDDRETFRKARALAQRALALGAEEGRARGCIGTTYVVEDDFTAGVAHLERAIALLPRRVDFALNLYAMYLRAGDRLEADALYAGLAERSRDPQTAFAARNVRLHAETARANELIQQGDLEGAANVVRALAAETAEGDGRRDLVRQAEQLAHTAAVNREIESYDEAIALTNAGKHREALRVIESLLESAIDPQVINDATELRRVLRGALKQSR